MKFWAFTYDGVFDIVWDRFYVLCPVVAACVSVVSSTCCEHYEEVDEGGYAVTVRTSGTIIRKNKVKYKIY